MALKQSVLNLLRVAAHKLPCSCKGKHFDDLDESQVDAGGSVDAVADAGLGLA